MFKTNEGTLDRALRILLGIGLIALAVTGPKTMWGGWASFRWRPD